MKKILVINHFPTISPPISGGTLRYLYLYKELSRYYDITLLSQTLKRRGGLYRFSPTFKEYRVGLDFTQLSTPIEEFTYEQALLAGFKSPQENTIFSTHFEQLYQINDIIIHESPYLVDHDKYLALDYKPRIYNSHNHEYQLASDIWKHPDSRKLLPYLFEAEKKLATSSDLLFATCEVEKNSFTTMYDLDGNKVKLAPNGIYPNEWSKKKKKNQAHTKPKAFFIGTDYPPNLDAVDYIVNTLTTLCPDIEFIVAGSCCNRFSNFKKPNLNLIGRINHKYKMKLFTSMDIAINPMFTGAGVNLKTLEFLSAGITLFSTDYGVRGLGIIDQKHYIQVKKDDFADKINKLAFNKEYLEKISLNGQRYINNKYSWENITKRIYEEIEQITSL